MQHSVAHLTAAVKHESKAEIFSTLKKGGSKSWNTFGVAYKWPFLEIAPPKRPPRMSFQQACQSKSDFGISRYKIGEMKRTEQWAESIREISRKKALKAAVIQRNFSCTALSRSFSEMKTTYFDSNLEFPHIVSTLEYFPSLNIFRSQGLLIVISFLPWIVSSLK